MSSIRSASTASGIAACSTKCASRSLRGRQLVGRSQDRLHESAPACRAASSSGFASPARPRRRAGSAAARRAVLRSSTRSPPGKSEDLIQELRGSYSVLMVTHNMQQASRTSDFTAFMYLRPADRGTGRRTELFTKPILKETEELRNRPLRLKKGLAPSYRWRCALLIVAARCLSPFPTPPPR